MWVAAPQSYAAAVPRIILFIFILVRTPPLQRPKRTRDHPPLFWPYQPSDISHSPPSTSPKGRRRTLPAGSWANLERERRARARARGREKSQDRPEPKEQNPLRLCHTSSARFLFACCSSTHYLIPDYCHLRLSSLASHWCRRSQFPSTVRSLGAASLFFSLLPLHRHRTYKLDSPRCAPQFILLKHEAKSFVNFFPLPPLQKLARPTIPTRYSPTTITITATTLATPYSSLNPSASSNMRI